VFSIFGLRFAALATGSRIVQISRGIAGTIADAGSGGL